MATDSDEEKSDPEATYQAFESSGPGEPRRRSTTLPGGIDETPATDRRESDRRTSSAAGRLQEEDSIPVDVEGHLFGKYRVLQRIGGGGMGFVWLVEHVGFEQRRALKIIKSDVADNPVNLDRFRREARILAKLSGHPNAVLVYDTNVVGKFAYIEMDYLEGQTLKNRLEQVGPMPMAEVAWFLGELCAVLGEAHALGIVHRDIKPQNIMIVPDAAAARGERVKVLDFGIAKIIRDAAATTASMSLNTEGFLGTYPYSSPEQLGLPLPGRREPESVDARSDIYSVGVLLYEMLAGVRPFSGALTRILYDHAHTPPPPFEESAPGSVIPADVEAVVRRCLEKDPARRFQSVRELIEGFRTAAGLGPSIPDDGSTQAVATATAPLPDVARRPSVSQGRRVTSALSRRNVMTVGALVVAAACVALLVAPRRDRGPAPPQPTAAPWIADWLRARGFEPLSEEGLDGRGWPRTIRRASGEPGGNLALTSGYYLPADFEADSSSGTGAEGLPKVLTSRKAAGRFVLLEGGTFTMGAFDATFPFDKDTEQPGHQVTLSGFYMQETEVSIGDFARFCEDRGLRRQSPEVGTFFDEWDKLADVKRVQDKEKLRDHPAAGVSHRIAVAYARWIGGDLPTEAQWEFAARSGGRPRLHVWADDPQGGETISMLAHVADWDASWSCEVGFRGNRDRTEQGLLHMAGNVREWCRDAWRTYRGESQVDPVAEPEGGDSHPRFAIRGGSYATPTETARVTWRGDSPGHAYRLVEEGTDEDLGFRVVLPVLACPPGPPAGATPTAWREVHP